MPSSYYSPLKRVNMNSKIIDTALPVCRDDFGLERIVVLGRPLVGLGDIVTYKLKGRLVGQRYISYKRTVSLKDLSDRDLDGLHTAIGTKESLWGLLNALMQTELDPQTEVTLLALSRSGDYYITEQIRPLTGKKRSMNTSEFFNIPDDEYEVYEDEYEGYETFEKIKRKSPKDD